MNLVTLHHVGVAYDGYEALKNVDLTIAQDDFLGIIGPNGGGKTTLVKAILGTVPHTGEVVLAPEFEPEAVEILSAKKNIRLLRTIEPIGPAGRHREFKMKKVQGGYLDFDSVVATTHAGADTETLARAQTALL